MTRARLVRVGSLYVTAHAILDGSPWTLCGLKPKGHPSDWPPFNRICKSCSRINVRHGHQLDLNAMLRELLASAAASTPPAPPAGE